MKKPLRNVSEHLLQDEADMSSFGLPMEVLETQLQESHGVNGDWTRRDYFSELQSVKPFFCRTFHWDLHPWTYVLLL